MLITKTSQATQKTHIREIDVTQEQLDAWRNASDDDPRRFIQNASPHLSADDREFLMTGITPEEWAAIFPPEEDEDLSDA